MTGTSLAEITPDRWAMLQRMAAAFCKSELVPEAMRDNVANCTVALLLAEQMGENPLMVTQNIFFIHGRAGWITQYMVARANNSGKFLGPLRWRSSDKGDDNPAETCFAKLASYPTDDPVEVEIDLKTAIDSGWTTYKKDGKTLTHPRWATMAMQRQMLRWRSAAWLIRLYAPEVMFGLPTADELEDTMKDVTPPKLGIDDFKPSGARKPPAPVIDHEAEGPGEAVSTYVDADGVEQEHSYDVPERALPVPPAQKPAGAPPAPQTLAPAEIEQPHPTNAAVVGTSDLLGTAPQAGLDNQRTPADWSQWRQEFDSRMRQCKTKNDLITLNTENFHHIADYSQALPRAAGIFAAERTKRMEELPDG